MCMISLIGIFLNCSNAFDFWIPVKDVFASISILLISCLLTHFTELKKQTEGKQEC